MKSVQLSTRDEQRASPVVPSGVFDKGRLVPTERVVASGVVGSGGVVTREVVGPEDVASGVVGSGVVGSSAVVGPEVVASGVVGPG